MEIVLVTTHFFIHLSKHYSNLNCCSENIRPEYSCKRISKRLVVIILIAKLYCPFLKCTVRCSIKCTELLVLLLACFICDVLVILVAFVAEIYWLLNMPQMIKACADMQIKAVTCDLLLATGFCYQLYTLFAVQCVQTRMIMLATILQNI